MNEVTGELETLRLASSSMHIICMNRTYLFIYLFNIYSSTRFLPFFQFLLYLSSHVGSTCLAFYLSSSLNLQQSTKALITSENVPCGFVLQ